MNELYKIIIIIHKEILQKCNTLVLSYFVYIISRSCSRKQNLDVLLNLVIDILTSFFLCKAFQIRGLIFLKLLA